MYLQSDSITTMDNFVVKKLDKNIAKKLIVDNHYSHKWTKCSLALGIYEKGNSNQFIDISDDILIGCMIYGDPIGADASKSISTQVTQGQVWELTRLWVKDNTPKNTESWFIGQSIKYIKQHHPHIKCLISYADPEFSHKGIIYQATNWIFQEVGIKVKRWMLSFSDSPFHWHHSKTIMDKYDCNGMADLKIKMPKPYWLKMTGRKFRYILPIGNRKENKLLVKGLKHPPKPYPKEIQVSDVPNEVFRVD